MAGYHGYSMSNNAVAAYEQGERPWSRWTKQMMVEEIRQVEETSLACPAAVICSASLEVLRRLLLTKSSWHHTSKNFNKTNFYIFDRTKLRKLTKERLEHGKEQVRQEQTTEERWLCSYFVWSGSRDHLIRKEVVAEGIIRGNWFYLADGHKKKVTGVGFQKLKRLDDGAQARQCFEMRIP